MDLIKIPGDFTLVWAFFVEKKLEYIDLTECRIFTHSVSDQGAG